MMRRAGEPQEIHSTRMPARDVSIVVDLCESCECGIIT
jgi:hypothetical protein